jgi:hypothetical protein
VVQSQGSSDRVKDVFGHAADVTLLQPRVPLRAYAGEDGDLLAPQPGDPATGAGRQPGLRRVILARRLARKSRISPRFPLVWHRLAVRGQGGGVLLPKLRHARLDELVDRAAVVTSDWTPTVSFTLTLWATRLSPSPRNVVEALTQTMTYRPGA